ncbi:bactofilin family protein [Rhodohalobacter halophilus]|uniref:bactofilin family protein n=1 Tax=Rhodohalobacter halophilus TaxID=1812810 RepID=UPI001FDF9830|nr:polymer-forming cytoskeletal protein [Rhodohalobacter halophilus]
MSKTANNQSPTLNMVSEGTTLEGTINSQNDIRIAGKLKGEGISKGKLIVTSSGVVQGDVKVAEADIAGKIEGTIRVTNKLNLRSSAVIDGDIYTKSLLVEEGAQINGACRMGSDSANLDKSSDSDFVKETKVKKEEEK